MPLTPAELLSPAGPVAARLSRFEERPEQGQMAAAVAEALGSRSRLLVEAGTGVGKSFAYLVPAILRCVLHGERVVVATATISLQEQLVQKDIPLLVEALGGLGDRAVFDLVPVLAKGRGNYLSIRRLHQASKRQDALLHDDASRHSLRVVEEWAYGTADGTLSTLPPLERPDVWDHVRSDSDNCMGRKCPHYKECFYQKARRELERANLIVCNHALFFADLALRSRAGAASAVLPAYDHVVLDEAHNVEDAACEHFGVSLSQPRVTRLLRTLWNPRRRKGYLVERTLALADAEAVERCVYLAERAEMAAQELFDALLIYWEDHRDSSGRMRSPGAVPNPLTPAMRDLALRLRTLRDATESEPDKFELNSFAKRTSDIADAAEVLIDQGLEGYVYWVEAERTEMAARMGPRVTLACAPVDIGPILRRHLFEARTEEREGTEDAGDAFEREQALEHGPRGGGPEARSAPEGPKPKGIVLTSATLATRAIKPGEPAERAETAFMHVMSSLGVSEARTMQLGSPFDYARQARVIIDLTMPSPRGGGGTGGEGGGYTRALAERILHHVRRTRGGAFVLFTSFSMLHGAADLLRRELEDEGLPLLVQGRDGSRQAILKAFVEAENAVLFGAASFWQGVDVRGERLRNVVITRLPFEPPDRPLTQARLEKIEASGGNPFMQDSLPRAVIRFKQGFGRLVRSRTDTGQVVVLDPRIRTARYGRLFLEALPPGVPVELQTTGEGEST